MSGTPRFSVVIPTRERAGTLPFAVRTCLAQDFEDFEVVVSDNASSPATRQVVEAFADQRIRYVRTPKLLAMSASWDFALSHAAGEYLTVLGDDDGLLLHALPEIDRIIRMLDTKVLHWQSVVYHWPDLPDQEYASPHELLVPLRRHALDYDAILEREARPMMRLAADSRVTYAQLPGLYWAAVHRSLIARLRARTGRVFHSRCPDVYSAFAVAHLVGRYHSVEAPMNIAGLSERSNGVAQLFLRGRSSIAEEFDRLNAEAGYRPHPRVPDLPFAMSALVAESFEHAKATLFPGDDTVTLDRKALVRNCLRDARVMDADEWRRVLDRVRAALGDDAALLGWFEEKHGSRPPEICAPGPARPPLRRYGGVYLHLDASAFGVRDVFGAAELCERLLGYRQDGVAAHLAPRDGV